jgi:hypothetical protein
MNNVASAVIAVKIKVVTTIIIGEGVCEILSKNRQITIKLMTMSKTSFPKLGFRDFICNISTSRLIAMSVTSTLKKQSCLTTSCGEHPYNPKMMSTEFKSRAIAPSIA